MLALTLGALVVQTNSDVCFFHLISHTSGDTLSAYHYFVPFTTLRGAFLARRAARFSSWVGLAVAEVCVG